MKLSEIKQILASSDIRPTKSLGQNFLHDGNQVRRIVKAAELQASDKVLEIGPGLGSLTEMLLAEASEVLAIEKDRRLVEFLQRRHAGVSDLILQHNDALEFLRRESRDWSDWKLVASLPYSVASPILVELAQADRCPERMIATLQLEVARRLIAKPGEEDYGLLTLLIRLRYEPAGWFKIRASCFFPAPDVDSACVTLIRHPEPVLNRKQTEAFTRIVKRSFSQRRKIMFKLLKEDWPEEKLRSAFDALQLSSQIRAEALSLEQFIHLTNLLI